MFADFYRYFDGILILSMFANVYQYFLGFYDFLVFWGLADFIPMPMFATLLSPLSTSSPFLEASWCSFCFEPLNFPFIYPMILGIAHTSIVCILKV